MARLRVCSFSVSLDGYSAGEVLRAGLDLPQLGYRCTEHVPTASTTHVVLTRERL